MTSIDENDKESKGISLSAKSWHSDDSGPGEKWGLFNLAKKIMYVCFIQDNVAHEVAKSREIHVKLVL